MKAHRVMVQIPASHEISLQLPADLPVGLAEVIVLSDMGNTSAAVPQDPPLSFEERFPRAGTLGPVTMLEDPTAPLHGYAWGEVAG